MGQCRICLLRHYVMRTYFKSYILQISAFIFHWMLIIYSTNIYFNKYKNSSQYYIQTYRISWPYLIILVSSVAQQLECLKVDEIVLWVCSHLLGAFLWDVQLLNQIVYHILGPFSPKNLKLMHEHLCGNGSTVLTVVCLFEGYKNLCIHFIHLKEDPRRKLLEHYLKFGWLHTAAEKKNHEGEWEE